MQKSQHQPSRYFQDLLRKFDISERLVPELNSRYKAVQFWADNAGLMAVRAFLHTVSVKAAFTQQRHSPLT